MTLVLENIGRRVGRNWIVRNLQLEIEDGECLARFALQIQEYCERLFRQLSSEAGKNILATKFLTFDIWLTLQHGTPI